VAVGVQVGVGEIAEEPRDDEAAVTEPKALQAPSALSWLAFSGA
jgi:hypothetical protein